MTGQAHLIMFANMVIESFVVCRPKCTHRAEVGIYPTAHQQHLCRAQDIARVKVPQAHHPQVSKAIRVTVGHVNAILALAHKHDSVYCHLLSVWHPGPFCQILEGGSHLSVEFGGVTALQPQHLSVGGNTKNTYLDDSAGACFGHLDIGTVVLGVDGTQVCWHDFITLVGLEALEVCLVAELANHVKVLLCPLASAGCHLDRRRPLFLSSGVLCI